MSNLVRQRNSLMFRPRSYMAFTTTPQPAFNLCSSAIGQPVANLERRNICILGIEGVIRPSGKLGCPPRLADRRALSAYRPCPPKGDTLQISAIN